MSAIYNNSLFSLTQLNKTSVSIKQTQIPISLIDALKADPEIKHKKSLKIEIKQTSKEKLGEALNEYFNYLNEQGEKIDVTRALNRLSEIVPLRLLEDAVRLNYPQHVHALHTAKKLFKEAEYYLEMSKKQNSFSIMAKVHAAIETLTTCIESILGAFGVADFFKTSENDMQASTKAQRVFALISLFGLLLTALVPIVGATIAAPLVLGAMFILASLSLIYPYIKPMPHFINKTVNWSNLLRDGFLSASPVEKDYLDRIAKAIITGKKVKTHPMLIGRSGVGKTETAKAFVKAIERGDYPELIGKKVFYINSADLLTGASEEGQGNKELQKISEAMGRHRKNIILIFDEIHILCQMKNNILAEQLKTMLDNAHKGFPNVIGITTQQEFYRDIYRNNPAFARRFKEINIENLEEKAVVQLLNGTFIQKTSSTLLDPEMLPYMYQQVKQAFPEMAQPAASLKILAQCFKKTSETQKSPLEERIHEITKQIACLNAENVLGQNGLLPYGRSNFDQINSLEKELAQLENQLQSHQSQVSQVYLARNRLESVKRKAYKNIVEISSLVNKSKKRSKLLKKYLLQSHFLAPSLEKMIRHQAAILNVKVAIDRQLINEVIEEEKDNQRNVEVAVQGGKKDLEARENGTIVIDPPR